MTLAQAKVEAGECFKTSPNRKVMNPISDLLDRYLSFKTSPNRKVMNLNEHN